MPSYTDEQKRRAVETVEECGGSVTRAMRKLGYPTRHFLLRKQVITTRHLGQTGKARGHHGAIMPAVDTLLELGAKRRALRTGTD